MPSPVTTLCGVPLFRCLTGRTASLIVGLSWRAIVSAATSSPDIVTLDPSLHLPRRPELVPKLDVGRVGVQYPRLRFSAAVRPKPRRTHYPIADSATTTPRSEPSFLLLREIDMQMGARGVFSWEDDWSAGWIQLWARSWGDVAHPPHHRFLTADAELRLPPVDPSHSDGRRLPGRSQLLGQDGEALPGVPVEARERPNHPAGNGDQTQNPSRH